MSKTAPLLPIAPLIIENHLEIIYAVSLFTTNCHYQYRSKEMNHFSQDVRVALMNSVGDRCSAPHCRIQTSGFNREFQKKTDGGEAAHIKGATPRSPRFDPLQSDRERHGFSNGIWLCPTCHTRIDKNAVIYPVELLMEWKQQAMDWHNEGFHQVRPEIPVDIHEELRRAKGFVSKLYQASNALIMLLSKNPPPSWAPPEVLPDIVAQMIFTLSGRTLCWKWNNNDEYWCFHPEFKNKQDEIIRIASTIAPSITGYSPTNIYLNYYFDDCGNRHYEHEVTSELAIFLDVIKDFNDFLSSYGE
jgi:hypothetical protein